MGTGVCDMLYIVVTLYKTIIFFLSNLFLFLWRKKKKILKLSSLFCEERRKRGYYECCIMGVMLDA